AVSQPTNHGAAVVWAGKGDQNHRIADCNASLLCEGLTRSIICIYRYVRTWLKVNHREKLTRREASLSRESRLGRSGIINAIRQLARCDRPLQIRITWLAATKNSSPVIAKQAASMNGVALRMLLGDRAKYMGLIFGIAFSTMLMSNQVSIFTGLML